MISPSCCPPWRHEQERPDPLPGPSRPVPTPRPGTRPFRAILQVPAQDLRIGASIWGGDARAINRAVSDAARLIARMPTFYTTYADKQPIFPARPGKAPAIGDRLVVDAAWLWHFGELEIPRHVWDARRLLNVWIEPIIVGEWARLMQGYGERQGRALSMDEQHRELAWLDPARDTAAESRSRASGPESRSTTGRLISIIVSRGPPGPPVGQRTVARAPPGRGRPAAQPRPAPPGAHYHRGAGASVNNQDSHCRCGTDGEQVTNGP
jgi:hypothetical protein